MSSSFALKLKFKTHKMQNPSAGSLRATKKSQSMDFPQLDIFAAFDMPFKMLCTLTQVEKFSSTPLRAALLRRWISSFGIVAPA
mmetsp:Transcript_80577/g.142681  ORF Transcript_80577/g.142681 Transcript_80577/m.142681 type:complete len:84 (+) Transcript_80577:56-307(+)